MTRSFLARLRQAWVAGSKQTLLRAGQLYGAAEARVKPERRFTSRERPERLSYIQFEPEGGGIVVNASQQGLAFHCAAAVRQNGPIQVCLSPNPTEQIKLSAEIAWMDERKRSGGLRFTEVTAEARNQIVQWLTHTSESEASSERFAAPPCAPIDESASRKRQVNGTSELPSPALEAATTMDLDSAALMAPRFRSIRATASLPVPFSEEKQISILWSRLLYGLATGFLILVFLFLPIFVSRNFRHEIGNALVRLGERLKGDRDVQPDPSASMPAQISNARSPSSSSVASPISEISAKDTLDHSDASASTQPTSRTVDSTDSLPTDPRNSPRHNADAPSKRSRSALARQLWSALGAGDTSAEVPLAELYLTGNGVPRNCEQARVLLRAASKRDNIEALRLLQQLKKSPCR